MLAGCGGEWDTCHRDKSSMRSTFAVCFGPGRAYTTLCAITWARDDTCVRRDHIHLIFLTYIKNLVHFTDFQLATFSDFQPKLFSQKFRWKVNFSSKKYNFSYYRIRCSAEVSNWYERIVEQMLHEGIIDSIIIDMQKLLTACRVCVSVCCCVRDGYEISEAERKFEDTTLSWSIAGIIWGESVAHLARFSGSSVLSVARSRH